MDTGCFSISLSVQNINASKTFYDHLGFDVFAGDADQGWLILKNGSTIIGLFRGCLKKTC